MIKNIIKNKYEIILKDKYIHLKYYNKVLDINENKIKILLEDNTIVINGSNLYVCALDEYELVIKGNVKSIEFINE